MGALFIVKTGMVKTLYCLGVGEGGKGGRGRGRGSGGVLREKGGGSGCRRRVDFFF